jgi:hypothetical protein
VPPGQAKREERQARETPAAQPENPAGHERSRDGEKEMP